MPNLRHPPDVLLHRTIFRHVKADWEIFRFYMMETPLRNFKHSVSKTAALVTDWILSRMVLYSEENSIKNQSTLVHPRMRFSHKSLKHSISYRKERSSSVFTAFQNCSQSVQKVLENAKCSYARAVPTRIEKKTNWTP